MANTERDFSKSTKTVGGYPVMDLVVSGDLISGYVERNGIWKEIKWERVTGKRRYWEFLRGFRDMDLFLEADDSIKRDSEEELKKQNDSMENTNGLSMRQYFAGLAMQGIISNPSIRQNTSKGGEFIIAQVAVKAADALIEELNKTE